MSYHSSRDRYLEMEISSRPQEWFVPLLYEQLLVRLRRAAVHIEARDFEGKAEALSRATDILTELLLTLDEEKGGEIAKQLSGLYHFFIREVVRIGRDMDSEGLAKLVTMIEELHEAWTQAAQQLAPRGGRIVEAPAA